MRFIAPAGNEVLIVCSNLEPLEECTCEFGEGCKSEEEALRRKALRDGKEVE